LDAARRLRFQPNRLARALATARSQTIGVVVHDAADPYFAQIIRGLEDVVGDHDHALFVASSDRDPETELACIRAFHSHQVDAIVLAASGIDRADHIIDVAALLDRFVARGGFVVSLSDGPYPSPSIRVDNREVAETATRHLIELGHRRIAYLSGPADLFVNIARLEGFKRALASAGISFDPDRVFDGGFTLRGGRGAATEVIGADVTGIVAANDLMAVGLLRGLIDRGLQIPDDISVVGIDNIELTEYAPVPLTTVHIPLTDLGRHGAQLVLGLLRGDKPTSSISPHHLIHRRSTGPPHAI
jgi:LacI family transcriptional regulator